MNLIACVDSNWGIGKDGDLLVHIPEDLKQFKLSTIDQIVICGRKTYESFPVKPLPDRTHLVLTHDINFADGINNVIPVKDFEMLKKMLDSMYDTDNIWIIGGESIYKEMVNWDNVSLAQITKVYNDYNADTFFPNLDENLNWEIVHEGELHEYNGIKYNFNLYQKVRD